MPYTVFPPHKFAKAPPSTADVGVHALWWKAEPQIMIMCLIMLLCCHCVHKNSIEYMKEQLPLLLPLSSTDFSPRHTNTRTYKHHPNSMLVTQGQNLNACLSNKIDAFALSVHPCEYNSTRKYPYILTHSSLHSTPVVLVSLCSWVTGKLSHEVVYLEEEVLVPEFGASEVRWP